MNRLVVVREYRYLGLVGMVVYYVAAVVDCAHAVADIAVVGSTVVGIVVVDTVVGIIVVVGIVEGERGRHSGQLPAAVGAPPVRSCGFQPDHSSTHNSKDSNSCRDCC